jgi:hypothetical protein
MRSRRVGQWLLFLMTRNIDRLKTVIANWWIDSHPVGSQILPMVDRGSELV